MITKKHALVALSACILAVLVALSACILAVFMIGLFLKPEKASDPETAVIQPQHNEALITAPASAKDLRPLPLIQDNQAASVKKAAPTIEELKALTIPDFPEQDQFGDHHQKALAAIRNLGAALSGLPAVAPNSSTTNFNKTTDQIEQLQRQQAILNAQLKELQQLRTTPP